MSHVSFTAAVDPEALVSEAAARSAFIGEVSDRVAALPFVVASPVTLRVTCATRPVRAPGLVEYPNLHRWLGPLIEALTGAGRMLLGRSQVTAVDVTTIAPPADRRTLPVTVVYDEEQRLSKADLRLVEFPEGWCASVPAHLSPGQARSATRRWSEALVAARHPVRGRHDLVQQGFIRRRDVTPDVPVVPARWLLGPDVDLAPPGPRERARAGPLS